MKDKRKFETHFFCLNLLLSVEGCLNQEESAHALKVFRLQKGDFIRITDGQGHLAECEIVQAEKSQKLQFRVLELHNVDLKPYSMNLAIGHLRDKDLERVVESCSQLELESITILKTDHSSEISKKNPERLVQRLRDKALVSLKQSKKTRLTQILGPVSLNTWLESNQTNLVLLDQNGMSDLNIDSSEKTTLLCGPEGGFSQREVERFVKENAQLLSLGKTRLRGRDAPMFALGKVL